MSQEPVPERFDQRQAVIRPMRDDDVAIAERLSALAFHDLDVRTTAPGDRVPELRSSARAEAWIQRTRHFLRTDPAGCWVADLDGEVVGIVTSLVREKMWILPTYAVRPGLQGLGLGKPLLQAALEHGRGCLRGMLSASQDPRAVRRYRLAGFSLHPQMAAEGVVDRAAIPVVTKVRAGVAGDQELMDSIDRRVRGAAHGPDHEILRSLFRLLVSDTSTGSGYVYLAADGRVELLAATNRRTATRLLWEALAATEGETSLGHLTPANEWALDVALAARLDLVTRGYLGLRGMAPPAPYVHHGALL